ncbi:MAG: Plug domain-containing protein, partial [Congregibacter sp.]|nr:Plug domain-containing protein [Congregibacter sp.]
MRKKAQQRTRTAVGTSLKVALPCLALTLGAEVVLAQTGSSAAANIDAEPGAALEEIMVFARRREEALQDVPIAIDVLDASDFFQRGLYNLTDVVAQSTSVYLEQGSVPQDLNLTIRGMNPTRGRPNMAILLDGIDITTESMITSGASLLVD